MISTAIGCTEDVSTEEEMDAVDALLSLHTRRENALDQQDWDQNNEDLIPVGSTNNYQDVAPVQVQLDQVNVDHAIVNIIVEEEHGIQYSGIKTFDTFVYS